MMRVRTDHPAARVAFTIVEMMIAIGAVALITVGLARLFAATGDTVKIGRRVSAMNEMAATIERTLREDISKMSRRGFLAIRNREVGDSKDVTADNPMGGVLLSADDPGLASRRRRVDEIVFFEEGQFASLRDPLYPARTATGSAARIYIGHGLRQVYAASADYDVDIGDYYRGTKPPLASARYTVRRPGFGVANTGTGPEYPNRFAKDWILLRHVTVLAPPQGTISAQKPDPMIAFPGNGAWGDSSCQIGLQPAAPDIFRAVIDKWMLPDGSTLARNSASTGEFTRVPRFSSGAIDVAATDLATIRARVLNAQDPATVKWPPDLAMAVDSSKSVLAAKTTTNPDADTNTTPSYRMKQWMLQAFPDGPAPKQEEAGDSEPERRMVCERDVPDALGTVAHATPYGDDGAFKRSDQLMLAASNFVPGCTEFIVEWSFGDTYASVGSRSGGVPQNLRGQLIWHGLQRWADTNGNGMIDDTAENREEVATPYSHVDDRIAVTQTYTLSDGTTRRRLYNGKDMPIRRGLIHIPAGDQPPGPISPGGIPEQHGPLYSCFGYIDPTFAAAANPGDPDTIAWPWPKLLRITVGLVDPTEPGREQRFQFVYEVPRGSGGTNP